MTDAHVHADHARPTVRGRNGPLDFDGERHVPAVGPSGDGGGQDAGGALLQPPRQLAGRLVGLDDTDPWQLDVLAVGQHADRAGGEAAGDPGTALLLPTEKADRATLAEPVAGVAPVLERPRERVQAAVVGLLAVLGPPRRHVMLGAVPLPPQLRKGPRHLDVLAGTTLLQAGGDQLQATVVAVQRPAGMGGEAAVRAW